MAPNSRQFFEMGALTFEVGSWTFGGMKGWLLVGLLTGSLLSTYSQGFTREENTTLKFPAVPFQRGLAVEKAFGALSFKDALAIASPPGDQRVFVVEQAGRIAVVTNLAAPTRSVFLDISGRIAGGVPGDERGLLGLAFHPSYASNGYFYIFYSTTVAGKLNERISRFSVDPADPNKGLLSSEAVLISQADGYSNHNGGDLHFGPDGYLYVSLGDEGDGNDTGQNSQRIDKDFFSGILRIDVDKRPGNLAPNSHPAASTNYFVPADNPFVGATQFNGLGVNPANVRTEFWAVGLRNPWRMAFDPATGVLFCADVGQSAREEVDIIVRGGNYGWAYREGMIAGPKGAVAGFQGINPIWDYPHGSGQFQGNSVTGGRVYRGSRIPELTGTYILADYVSGNVWGLRQTNGTTWSPSFLLKKNAIAGFGYDPSNGDILLADQSEDTIQRLTYGTNVIGGGTFPPTLADAGIFKDLASLAPQAGVVPYEVNVPYWANGAVVSRWFSLPSLNQKFGFSAAENWTVPAGGVFVQHFDLPVPGAAGGNLNALKRVETRVLVRTADGVYGLSYRWDDNATNATLVPEGGADATFQVLDDGTVRSQRWHYPARTECLACHTKEGHFVLGFKTAQLDREAPINGAGNQLAAWHQAGYFSNTISNWNSLRRLVPLDDFGWSREYRVRSYLDANCAQCHQPGGSAFALFDARAGTLRSLAGIINGALKSSVANPANKVAVPGDAVHSELLARMISTGADHMPPLAGSVIDAKAVEVIRDWIMQDLPEHPLFEDWQVANFGGTGGVEAGVAADPDGDGASNLLEYFSGTDPKAFGGVWRVEVGKEEDGVMLQFLQKGGVGYEIQGASRLGAGEGTGLIWRPLDIPENKPFFPAEDVERRLMVPATAEGGFFRVRLFEQ